MTTPTRETFLANLPDLEMRTECARLYEAAQDAADALSDARDAKDDSIGVRIGEINARAAEERRAIYDERDAAPEIARLKEAEAAAEAAWLDFDTPGDVALDEDCENPLRCALTGMLIHEKDHVMKDEQTGEVILKVALGVPLHELTGEFELDAGSDASDAEVA